MREDRKVHVRRMVWFAGVLLKPLLTQEEIEDVKKKGRPIANRENRGVDEGLRVAAKVSRD